MSADAPLSLRQLMQQCPSLHVEFVSVFQKVDSRRRSLGNVEIQRDFDRVLEGWVASFYRLSMLSTLCHFHGPVVVENSEGRLESPSPVGNSRQVSRQQLPNREEFFCDFAFRQ